MPGHLNGPACPAQVLELLYALLRAADPELSAVLAGASVPPFFALSWLITWFAHDVHSLQVRAGCCLDQAAFTACHTPAVR